MPAIESPGTVIQTLSELPALEVNNRLRAAVAELQRAESNVMVLFYVVMNRRIYRELGYASIHLYARKELEFTDNKTYQFIRLVEDLDRLPALRTAVFNDEIGWTKAKIVTQVASVKTEKAWLAQAQRCGRRQLVEKVKHAREKLKAEGKSDPLQVTLEVLPVSGGAGAEGVPRRDTNRDPDPVADGPISVTLRFTPLEYAQLESMIEKIHKSRKMPAAASREAILLQGVHSLLESEPVCNTPSNTTLDSAEFLRRRKSAANYRVVIYKCESCSVGILHTQQGDKRLSNTQLEAVECDSVVDKSGERNHQTIPPSVRNEVMTRDRHQCQAPGCTNSRFLEVHHLKARRNGGNNKPDNLITLCSTCHRFWHERKLTLGRRKN